MNRPQQPGMVARPRGMGRVRRIHFVGAGGAGMGGIAEVLHNLGYAVSGSDLKASAVTERLTRMGAKVLIGHQAPVVEAGVEFKAGQWQGVVQRAGFSLQQGQVMPGIKKYPLFVPGPLVFGHHLMMMA